MPQAAIIVPAPHDLNLDLGRTELLIRLEKALTDRLSLPNILEVHPLGFIRIPFTSDRREDGFYLHLWTGDSPQRAHAELPHSHSFSMRSRILYGEMTNSSWRVVDDSQGDFRLGAAAYHGPLTDVVPGHRRVSYALQGLTTIGQDESYQVLKGEFHSSAPLRGTVTLMQKMDSDYSRSPDNILPYTQNSEIRSSFVPEAGFDSHAPVLKLLDTIHREISLRQFNELSFSY